MHAESGKVLDAGIVLLIASRYLGLKRSRLKILKISETESIGGLPL